MHERFTDRARKVMQLANQEAQRFNHAQVGTEHILFGLVREGSGLAASVLKNLGVNVEAVRREIEKEGQEGTAPVASDKLSRSPRAKRCIEAAVEEARNLDHNYVGTEHLLLGLLREPEGLAARLLLRLGLQLEQVRQEVFNYLGHTPGASKPGTPAKPGKPRTPALDTFGRDLATRAAAPAVRRPQEVERIVQVLSCRTWNRLLLVGHSPSVTAALAETVARQMVEGPGPDALRGRRLIALNLAGLLAGTAEVVTERLRTTLHEALVSDGVLLFVNELHLLCERHPGADLPGRFRAHLLHHERVPLLAATTPPGLTRCAGSGAVLSSLFDSMPVAPATVEEATELLRGSMTSYEVHHRVKISDAGLRAAVELSSRCGGDLPQPEAAQRVLDRAGGLLQVRAMRLPPDAATLELRLRDLNARLDQLAKAMEKAVSAADFETAARLRDETDRLKEERTKTESARGQAETRDGNGVVDEEVVRLVVEAMSATPG